MGKENFERHKQPWNGEEAGKLKLLASKGQGLKQIAKALNRSEESTRDFAKKNKIAVAKKRGSQGDKGYTLSPTVQAAKTAEPCGFARQIARVTLCPEKDGSTI